VAGIISKFGSDKWIPDLRTLCLKVSEYIQKKPGGKFLKFSDEIGDIDHPGRIVKEYHRTAKILKLDIFGDNVEQSYIDHHKIAALYIRAFLKFRPFYLDIPTATKNPEISMYAKSANEYFIIPYLEAVFKGWNSNFDGVLRIDPVYQDNFIMQLHQYKNNINKLDPTSFSTILFFIEKNYFKHNVL